METRRPRAWSVLALIAWATTVSAWGPEGHTAVGILAMQQIDGTARAALNQILQSTDPDTIEELCNWPDAIREDPSWEWTSPQHYVNIPRAATNYDRNRDCPDGLCVTEAIKKYAQELQDPRLARNRRQQAFAWLCHLVGDLHQPLHCGFADDRGGNSIEVEFKGTTVDLHHFWDGRLIRDRSESTGALLASLAGPPPQSDTDARAHSWSPREVDRWTGESHRLAQNVSYPESLGISDAFADQSWSVIQRQIPLAAQRLARILDATLGKGDVDVSPTVDPCTDQPER
ncbi:S1/P1 nuclease [Elongatibacter sediminis]|uniref:S1/P1 nuclease n=1 Tax=Elongatibacter sediminis TaxID=3119006 RepID=A0AAW9R7M5_9GAMM